MPGRLIFVVLIAGITAAAVALSERASASPGDVYITQLNCDTSPEFVRIENFGGSSQPLSDFYLQSFPVRATSFRA